MDSKFWWDQGKGKLTPKYHLLPLHTSPVREYLFLRVTIMSLNVDGWWCARICVCGSVHMYTLAAVAAFVRPRTDEGKLLTIQSFASVSDKSKKVARHGGIRETAMLHKIPLLNSQSILKWFLPKWHLPKWVFLALLFSVFNGISVRWRKVVLSYLSKIYYICQQNVGILIFATAVPNVPYEWNKPV